MCCSSVAAPSSSPQIMNTVSSEMLPRLARTRTTMRLRGTRKMLYTVARTSSGTYLDLRIPILGQYTPHIASKMKKQMTHVILSEEMIAGRAMQRAATANTSRMYRAGEPRQRMTASTTEEPTIMHAMKHPNTCPCGRFSKRGSILGVHMNTNMYIEPSKQDWIMPSTRILGSFWNVSIATLSLERVSMRVVPKLVASPLFSPHVNHITAAAKQRKTMARSKGATRLLKESRTMAPIQPASMAHTPLPTVASENVWFDHSLG
mmetsp:Transcript_35747/g.73482  ORF Transcript_35747/g.73482 Transcript_35747/m.73482 type:complete len:262 (-) Transcript_35747:490-1275(-)